MNLYFQAFRNISNHQTGFSSILKGSLVYFVLFFLPFYKVIGQEYSIKNENKIYNLNRSAFLFKNDTINELWTIDKSTESWKLNNYIEIISMADSKLRLWKQGNNGSLWIFDNQLKDWKQVSSFQMEIQNLNDTLNYSLINDSIKLLNYNQNKIISHVNKNIFVWSKSMDNIPEIINDTISLFPVNDTTKLWMYKDSVSIWQLNTRPKLWKISKSTIVWTLDPYTEFWKAGMDYNFWYRKTLKDQWQQNQKIIPKFLKNEINYWSPNDSVILFSSKDTVQIWKASKKKSIWQYHDSLMVWTIPPPAKKKEASDTLIVQVREVKKAQLLDIDETIKLWTINDSTRVFNKVNTVELWKKNTSAKLWKITDSTLIWNIDLKTKLSSINDSLAIWLRNDTTYEWKQDSLIKPEKVSKNLLYLNVNDSVRFTNQNDTMQIWNSYSSAKIATKKSLNAFLLLSDTIEFWEPNDSTKLWINKYSEKGEVWEKNKQVNILNINDSTKIWQLSENVRLTIINGKLRIWRQGNDDPYFTWKEANEFRNEVIEDSVKIWHINKNTIIWETRQKIEVWNLNKKLELFRLNDTSLIWTYSTSMVGPKLPKPKYWVWQGTGRVDMAQVFVDQWASGGENSLSSLFIINFQANYNKKKVKWTNDFEYRLGFIRPGDDPLRKNEDRIKINSIINYFAFKKWYYGFTVETQTQFFNGYKYINDTTKNLVSDFMAPSYSNFGIGLNYFPVKQLSVFFSPLTNKIIFVKDTVNIDASSYGIKQGKKMKTEPGAFIKSVLNWNITKNINLVNKFDLFLRYNELKKYNVDWEMNLTFKFNNLVNATLNTHLVYDPNVSIKQPDGNTKTPVQFKEVLSIGLFYKI
ncbi:MAG: DUF3078 domain-containing protein [Bacteroidales bacterium]